MQESGPLSGVTVVEMGRFISAPYATMILADLGASVIKVESRDGGDPFRHVDDDPMPARFLAYNRGKRSVAIDLRDPDGRSVALDLLRGADVLVENFRPGVMESFGLGYDSVRAVNPGLVYCSITGAGEEGPLATFPMYDAIGQALSGLSTQMSAPGDPQPRGPALSDSVTGMTAALAVQAALLQRHRTGEGTRVRTSLLQASVSFLAEPAAHYFRTDEEQDWLTRPSQSQSFGFVASDDRPLIIHMSSPQKFWDRTLQVLGRADLASDPRFDTYLKRVANHLALQEEMQKTFSTRPREEWLQLLSASEVPAAPLMTTRETFAHPQVQVLGLEQRLAGDGGYRVAGPGATVGDWNPTLPEPPRYAADTDDVLGELGYDDERIQRLRAEGAIL